MVDTLDNSDAAGTVNNPPRFFRALSFDECHFDSHCATVPVIVMAFVLFVTLEPLHKLFTILGVKILHHQLILSEHRLSFMEHFDS